MWIFILSHLTFYCRLKSRKTSHQPKNTRAWAWPGLGLGGTWGPQPVLPAMPPKEEGGVCSQGWPGTGRGGGGTPRNPHFRNALCSCVLPSRLASTRLPVSLDLQSRPRSGTGWHQPECPWL